MSLTRVGTYLLLISYKIKTFSDDVYKRIQYKMYTSKDNKL